MTCLAEERFIEILDQGGLDAVRPEERDHLDACDNCRESWASVAAAGEILAEARPRSVGRANRIIPLVAAAAMMLTIVGVVAFRKTPSPVTKPIQDPLTLFLEGKPEEVKGARAALLQQGRKALPGLVAARPRLHGSARLQPLQDLIWELKASAMKETPDDEAVLRTLDTMKIDLGFENTRLDDVLNFIRDFSKLNIVLDPTVDAGLLLTFKVQGLSLRMTLDFICACIGLDFDYRYKVVYFCTPMRLWSTDPKVGLPEANFWASQPDSAPSQKLRTIRVTVDVISSPVSAICIYLNKISGMKFTADPAIASEPILFNVRDLTLHHVVELMTLPYGWDARIEDEGVTIFKRPQ